MGVFRNFIERIIPLTKKGNRRNNNHRYTGITVLQGTSNIHSDIAHKQCYIPIGDPLL